MTLLREGEQALDTAEGQVAQIDLLPLQDKLSSIRSV
jgi:exonuclease VII small subunit